MLADVLFALYGVPGDVFVEMKRVMHDPISNSLHYKCCPIFTPTPDAENLDAAFASIELSREASNVFYPTEVHLLNKCAQIGSLFRALKAKCEFLCREMASTDAKGQFPQTVLFRWCELVESFIDEHYVKELANFEAKSALDVFEVCKIFQDFESVFCLLLHKPIDYWLGVCDDAELLIEKMSPFQSFFKFFRHSLRCELEASILENCFVSGSKANCKLPEKQSNVQKCHVLLDAFRECGGNQLQIDELKKSLLQNRDTCPITQNAACKEIDRLCWRNFVHDGTVAAFLQQVRKFYFLIDFDFCSQLMGEISSRFGSNIRASDLLQLSLKDEKKDAFHFAIKIQSGFVRKSKIFDEEFLEVQSSESSQLGKAFRMLFLNESALDDKIQARLENIHRYIGRIAYCCFVAKQKAFSSIKTLEHQSVFQEAIYLRFVTGLLQYCMQDVLGDVFGDENGADSKSDASKFNLSSIVSFAQFFTRFSDAIAAVEEMLFLDAPSVQETILKILRWPKTVLFEDASNNSSEAESIESLISLLVKGFYSISTVARSDAVNEGSGNSWSILKLINRVDLNEFYFKKF